MERDAGTFQAPEILKFCLSGLSGLLVFIDRRRRRERNEGEVEECCCAVLVERVTSDEKRSKDYYIYITDIDCW